MNAVVETINTAGRAFVDFVVPMLIQSSLLILILLAVDTVLRKRVRAVFRYWIWLLVLVKLMLPPSLWSPVSLGTWLGATLEAPTIALLEAEESPSAQAPVLELVSPAVSIPSPPRFARSEPPRPATMETMSQTPAFTDVQRRNVEEQAGLVPAETSEATAAVPSPSATLSWQGLTLVIWAAVVGALLLLLVQRAFFVRGLVAQADGAGRALLDVLRECRVRAGVRGQVSLRLSPNTTSPAVCGLIRPVILVPQNLAPRLHARDLRAVLLHELAHVKRGDLWVNLVQTLLQIVYFYHPLLWLANAAMRRAREQAVDETVLVALGETAAQYPETLVNVAKLAFRRRPALSLRLIGVVESKSALTARIRHILSRPTPKTARLGMMGLATVLIAAVILLPMAKAQQEEVDTGKPRLVLLPNCGVSLPDLSGQDLPVLDLASGRILVLPAVKNEDEFLQIIEAGDEGDILYYYDRTEGAGKVTFLRSTNPGWLSAQNRKIEYKSATIAINTMKMPLETTIVTRRGDEFNVRITRADRKGCSIEFSPLKGAAVFEAVLADGVTVELLGASEHPSVGKPWWRPDGSPLAEPPYDQIGGTVSPGDSETAFEFAVRLRNLPTGAETTIKTEPAGSSAGDASPPRSGGEYLRGLRWLATVLPGDLKSCTLLCGVAAGEWETIAESEGARARSQSMAMGAVSFSPAIESADKGVAVTVTDDMTDRPSRIVAVTTDGRIVTSSPALTSSAGMARQMTAYFKNLTLPQVAEFRFQTRPWTWVEFQNVSLRSGRETGVTVHVESATSPGLTQTHGLSQVAVSSAEVGPAAVDALAKPASSDSDGDGLTDFQEAHKYLTDPTKADSDGDGTPDGDWDERREYAYSVRTVLRYMPPFDEDGLNDDFQDARVLNRTDEYIEVEVIHYPLATGYESIPENPNWRRDNARDARLAEYLAPGVTTNWDEQMRRDLLAALKADGIEVETLTDKQVVEQVSRWLLHRSRSLDKVFTTYYVDFPDGQPRVYPGLEDTFRREFERDSGNYDWTIEQHFDHELLGKGMFYNKTHGSCTSTAVYLTTVLRALGIPTRMVLATPAVDASDRAQILMVKNAITHHRVRETILAGLRRSRSGWTNHTFNEVYLGHRWCRLDYNQLGCPILGVNRFGLQTHLYTLNDLSDVNFAPTWGRRYARGWRNEFFEHDNPYSAVEVSDLFGAHANLPNPPFTAQDLHLPSNPRPNIFVLCPARAPVWDTVFEIVKERTWDKTARAHAKEFYENLFEGVWTTKPGDILVLLFSLDTSERIPAGYEDLLPQPWFEIESQLQQSRTVELSGKARAKNVILLAAPTAQELKPLVQNSKLLQTIGGAGPVPSAASTPPAALAPSATKPAKLPNGATIELLGVSEYPSEGKPWWRPDGSTLDAAPYKTTNNKRELKEGFRDYELVVRYGGAPDMDIEWDVPGSASTGVTGSPYDADGAPIRDLTVCTVRFPEDRTTTEVRVAAAAGAWETRATHNSPEREGTYALDDGRAVAFGIAHFREGRTLVPVTTNFLREDIDFRVVAVRDQDQACTGGLSGFGDGNLRSLTYLFNCPLSDIKEFRVQTRPWAWTTFNNVSLRPGHQTDFAVKLPDAKTTTAPSGRVSGAGKIVAIGPAWEVLRDELGPCYRGSIGGFSTDERRCVEYFEKVLSWAGPGDTFVLMFAFDRAAVVPASYQDLLPLPWSEIESRVRQGEQVEARGTARDLNVVLLAAPTFEQLNTLIRQTHLLDAFRTNISADEKTAASDQGAGGGALAGRQTSPDADAASVTPVVAELPDGDVGTEETLPEQVQFGPSVERVLGRDATYIDLEQGMTPSPPSDLLEGDKTQALLQWCRSNGIDAIADPATGSLNCLDAQVVELNPDAWTSLSIDGLRQAVERGPRLTSPPRVDGLPVVSLRDAGRPAATYGLRTRTGTLGLLQIVDAANPQDGGLAFVKIRYRLALAAIAENTAPERRELWLGLRQYLDLDTGRFVDVAPGEATDPKTLMSRGVDLYLTVEPFTANGPPVAQIQSLQLEFAPAPARLYLQEIAADQVREALQMAVRQLDKPKRVTAHVAECTYAFRTVEGTAGVFRVIWARNMDVPPCTLQYRLIPELDIPGAAFPWGAPAEGRQCRLRAPQRAWRADETATLSLDVRNQGKEALHFLPVAAAQCELEVDGAWYGWAEPLVIGTPVRVLEPGTELNDALDIRLTDSWALPADGVPLTFAPGMAPRWGRRLVLAPGRHAVRVRFYASENRLSPDAQGLSVISNPVEIAILSPEESASEGALVGPAEKVGESADDGDEKLFSVYGTVTDPCDRPMAGVEVTAHCGFATLMATGRAVTDEAGRYTLHFKPGILSREVMLQAATICARKVGFYEASLCRQGHLAMAGRMPSGPEQQRIAHYVGVVLPNQPHELNFVMRPAARIEGELVDARGKPLPGRTLVLTGEELYPSTSALASVETDQDGAFVIESVPLESFWFEYGHRPPVRSASMPFSIPGTWPIRLKYDESAPRTPRLMIVNLRQPPPVPGPLGRHALSFDGVDDCLIVPASPSVTVKVPFFIEVWAKPDLSTLPDSRWAPIPDEWPWPEMSLIRQGKLLPQTAPAQAQSSYDNTSADGLYDGWPKLRVPQAHGLNGRQSGGFMGFLLRRSGGFFAVGQDGRASQTSVFRVDPLSPDRPGWLHVYALQDYMQDQFVPSSDGPLVIGGRIVPNGLAFKGEIAEVRIWNRVLTSEEARHYGAISLTGNEPNLVACWDFERQAGGQVVYDITPNANHAYLGTSPEADGADPRWVSLDAGQSLTTTSATEYVRRYLEDWKTTARNNYLLKDYEILDEYVLEGSTGAVAFVWVRNTLIAAGGVDTRPHEGVIFLYRLNTDRWEGIFNFDGALGQAKNPDRVDRLLTTYRQEWCSQYLARIEQGYISAGGQRRPDWPVDRIPVQAAEGNANRQVDVRLADERGPVGTQTEAVSRSQPSERTEDALKHLIDEAQPGRTVTVPKGRYTAPVEITKPVVLRGESQGGCIIEVTADQPAVVVNTGGKGEVTLENLTIQWQLASSGRVEQPFALAVKDTNAVIRNCRFVPLGDYRRSPVAVRIDGFSKTTVDHCRFNGFEYVICYGEGTEGTVQDCVITDCGHEGVINYARATLTVQGCLITGSKFHAVRCTGGTLHVKDNLLIKNANRGIYLGNKTGRGTITNNLILGNGAGISGFGRAEYAIANNVIVNNKYTGINMRDSCRLSIRDNVLARNQGGLAVYKEGTENYNVIARNTYWSNTTDFENVEKPAGSLTADPQFADPNHGDFSVRGPAREAGHGLTNPQIIRELWKKYERLQRERPAEPATRADSVPSPAQVQVSTPVSSQTQSPILPAWQRTDLYVPPDPDGFFPDDPEGGRRLDALFQAVDKDKRSDEEILSTVRQGLRRTTQHRTLILAWIGNRYIWGKEPQNPQAVEIMYHAVPLERHYAIYFGLSVVKNKSPNLLRTLADICMQGEEVGRITWGIGPQRDEMLSYITPYLQDGDAGRREIAGLLVKHFRGELDFEKWQRERRLEQIKVEFQDQLPRLRETLLTGDSQARREVLTTIQRNGLGSILDDSFLAALAAAATDRDWKIRNDVARLAGGRWVWNAPAQDPNAIDLMLQLSRDSNREVYYNAVYFGLSTVRDKGEPVVRRLIEMALAEHENNLYGRIVWGLKGPMKVAPEPFVKILAEHLGRTKSDVHYAASVYLLYRDVLEQEPPGEWGLAHIKERYPEDLFAVPFSAREPFVPKDTDALWAAFIEKLPEGVAARRLPEWIGRGSVVCSAGVRGREQADMVKESIESNPRLRLGESYPLPLSIQLFLEEKYGPAGSGPVGGLPESQPQAKGPAPAEAVAAAPAAPGPIQQRIDAAAPGATIRLEPGVYKERLVINKPLTLEGAGWDKTVVMTEKESFGSLDEVQRIMMQRVAQGRSDAEREQIAAQVKKEFVEKMSPLMLSVENAQGVVVRGIKFSSPGGRVKGASVSLPIVKFDHSRARMVDCAVLAGPGNGIHIQDGSDVEIDRTLVAAVWGTGLGVTSGAEPSRAHVHDSDIRNCHYAGIRIAGRSTEAVIERCRISGAAWHGVRYDDVSPTLRDNLIFGNARCGIYASGQTAATVKNNLLYDNEMTGMSCWFQNQDVIEGNTFAGNERSGLEVLGASEPVVVKNIFYDNPTAVHLGDISGRSPFARSDGQITLENNLFWANEHNLQWWRNADAKRTIPLDEKAGAVADPQFADPTAKDFSLPADSPARQKGIGAAGLIPFESPWPLQPEELAIIPKGDTRDSRQWREPS